MSMIPITPDLSIPEEELRFSVSHTTRKPRPNEVDGQDYHFVDEAAFARMVAADELAEHYDVLYTGAGGRVAVEVGVALGVAHTNYDAAPGGVADALAAALGIEDTAGFGPAGSGESVKIVTFVPEAHVERIAEAMGIDTPAYVVVPRGGPLSDLSLLQGERLVVKTLSPSILHKSDVGGVRVDLRNADEVGAAFREMTGALRRQDPQLRVQVQGMISGGHEVPSCA